MNLSSLYIRLKHLKTYLPNVKTRYGVHSPFVYDFILHVLAPPAPSITHKIEDFRQSLTHRQDLITYEDLGAGMEGGKNVIHQPSISLLAKRASRRKIEGAFLTKLCQYYQPKRCLELGTHLGISALYQLAGLRDSLFVSLEGVPALHELAQSHIQAFGLEADLKQGNFDDLLPEMLGNVQATWDYVLIDGNHREEPTIRYTEMLLPHMAEGGIMVFDDISWSEGMYRAWQQIMQMPEVSVSIDLFRMGICFVKRNQAKEHFALWM